MNPFPLKSEGSGDGITSEGVVTSDGPVTEIEEVSEKVVSGDVVG